MSICPSLELINRQNLWMPSGIKMKRDIKNQQKQRRSPTYDQFLTAAVISGFDLRNRLYTMFAPEDGVFAQLNLSLPLLALKDKNCVAQIVRYNHTASLIQSNKIICKPTVSIHTILKGKSLSYMYVTESVFIRVKKSYKESVILTIRLMIDWLLIQQSATKF